MYFSVIPMVKMPFGNSCFDYQTEDTTLEVGDLILVSFRNRLQLALVAEVNIKSKFESKLKTVSHPRKILSLGSLFVDFLRKSADEVFVSPSTMLHALLRVVPKRLSEKQVRVKYKEQEQGINKNVYLLNRYLDKNGILDLVKKNRDNKRVLILTPWQRRIDFFKNRLDCYGFSAKSPYGLVWKNWNNFIAQNEGVLVTTRVGAWLSFMADIVIIDEPENDDYKQDEMTPRYDARRIIDLAQKVNPNIQIFSFSLTPRLKKDLAIKDVPEINADVIKSPFIKDSWSVLEGLTGVSVEMIAEAEKKHQAIRILHPVHGTRGRIRCADCGWVMNCPDCGYGLTMGEKEAI